MKRCLLLACVLSLAGAAEFRTLARASLLDVGAGPTTRLLTSETPPAVIPFSVGELALGINGPNRLGAGFGTSVVEGTLLQDISAFPLRAWIFYRLGPERRWRAGMASVALTYHHSGRDGWSGSALNPYWKLTGGVSYTWYAITPHAELGYDFREKFASLTAGIAVGGTYLFR